MSHTVKQLLRHFSILCQLSAFRIENNNFHTSKMNFFGGKKEPNSREQQREITRAQRQMGRTEMDLEREEKKLEADIRKAAKQGQNQLAQRLAKQLIQLRKQKSRTTQVKSRIGGIGTQIKVGDANLALAKAMGGATSVMKATNDKMDSEKISNILKQFEAENMKLDMKDELIDETLDSVLGDSDDEAESDMLVNKVLDEIGIEINQKLSNAGTVPKNSLDVDELLASLEPSSSKKSGVKL